MELSTNSKQVPATGRFPQELFAGITGSLVNEILNLRELLEFYELQLSTPQIDDGFGSPAASEEPAANREMDGPHEAAPGGDV